MKTPTLEEAKEYFKYAETIQDHSGDIGFPESNKFEFTQLRTGIVQNINKKNWLVLWHEKKGYAKILTYKTPKFEITKEQILLLMDKCKLGGVTEKRLKEWFPEVFEIKLEVGKWYKTTHSREKCLFCFTGGFDIDGYPLGYGFDSDNKFQISDSNCGWGFEECNPRIATCEEVQQALEKEAVKRGFEDGVYFKVPNSETISICKDKITLNKNNNSILYYGDYCIFKYGVWAEIIPTITKQEAEEKLKCKIV